MADAELRCKVYEVNNAQLVEVEKLLLFKLVEKLMDRHNQYSLVVAIVARWLQGKVEQQRESVVEALSIKYQTLA